MRDVANDARRLGRNLIELQCRATEGQCPICTREMQGQPVYHLKCGHTMHKGCVLHRRRSANAMHLHCAVCRVQCFEQIEEHTDDLEGFRMWLLVLAQWRPPPHPLAPRAPA
jgi:hypothetical protein